MAGDEPEANERAGPRIGRRRFVGAVGGASVTGLGTARSASATGTGLCTARSASSTGDESPTHFVEATLEFDLRDETITPGHRNGPRPYTVARADRGLFVHDRLGRAAHEKLLADDAVVFGLGSFRTAPATFARGTTSTLPVAGSATPRRTRFIRLDEWDGAPTYRVRTAAKGVATIEVANRQVAVPRDATTSVRLNDRVVPSENAPGYDPPGGVEVTPRLEIRNYGTVDVRDAQRRHNA